MSEGMDLDLLGQSEPDLKALVDIVKQQWRDENLRAEEFRKLVDLMRPVVVQAQKIVTLYRQEGVGFKPNTVAAMLPLLGAVDDYEWGLKQR